MKKFKKLVSAIAAVLCICTVSIPFTASADYDPCDVNHDGNVDIFDVIRISKYMNGTVHVTNYNVLDADENMIVDGADVEYVAQHASGNNNYSSNFISRTYTGTTAVESPVSFQWSSGGGVDLDSASTLSRQYRKYVYATGNTSYYSLTPLTPTTVNSMGDSINGAVDGTDNTYKTTLPENSGIVILGVSNNGSYPRYKTGFIVGDHQIATAAANLYEDGTFLNTLEIRTCSDSGFMTGTELHEIAAHVPSAYINRAVSPEFDYALITVTENLADYPHFAIGNVYNLSTANFQHIPVFVTGSSDKYNCVRLCSQVGNFSSLNSSTGNMLRYNTDTVEEAEDGAPVYSIVKDSNNHYFYTALSVNAGNKKYSGSGSDYNYNRGVRFTKYHKQFYLNNAYAESDYSGLMS